MTWPEVPRAFVQVGLAASCLAACTTAGVTARMSPIPGFALSDFNDGRLGSALDVPWRPSTDEHVGGGSSVTVAVLTDSQGDGSGSMSVRGRIDPRLPFAWAGAVLYPGGGYETPANLSDWKEISFRARGDGGTYRLMVLAGLSGGAEQRAETSFTAPATWTRRAIPLSDLAGIDLTNVRGILLMASVDDVQAEFDFEIDDVAVRTESE